MTEKVLERYSRICDECAKKEGGVCHKEQVWMTLQKCDICDKETSCLSAKDYNLPKYDSK